MVNPWLAVTAGAKQEGQISSPSREWWQFLQLCDKWNPPSTQNHFKVEPRTKYNTLEQLLDDYKQSGVDSEGHFTLNPIRARELLEQFQLPEATHYLVHLVCFLVGAGAKGIAISSTRSQIRLEASGARVEKETLASPFSVLLRGGAEPHLAELALGLNTILGQDKGYAELRYDRWCANYSPSKIEVSEGSPTNLLTIVAGPRLESQGKDRELELIRELFRWCPVPIRFNGQSQQDPRPTSRCEGIEIYLKNDEHPLLLHVNSNNRLSREIKAPLSALIRVGRHRPGFRIIHLGREYRQEMPWQFVLPGWQIDLMVSSLEFKKDLSQQSILHNDLYFNVLASLRSQLESASALLLQQIPQLPGSEELADELVERLFQAGKIQQALDYQTRLAQELTLGANSLEKGRAIYRLALMEQAVASADHSRAPRAPATQPHLGLGVLQSLRCREAYEPKWTILRCKMAYDPKPPQVEAGVQEMLFRSDVPPVVKEQCYRWLLVHGHRDRNSLAWYRVCLARQIYEGGRIAEAEAVLAEAEEELENSLLHNNSERYLSSLELRAEIAAELGQLETSLELFAGLLAGLRERHGQYNLRLGVTLERLAVLLDCAGKKKQAKEYRAWSKRLYQ